MEIRNGQWVVFGAERRPGIYIAEKPLHQVHLVDPGTGLTTVVIPLVSPELAALVAPAARDDIPPCRRETANQTRLDRLYPAG